MVNVPPSTMSPLAALAVLPPPPPDETTRVAEARRLKAIVEDFMLVPSL
jgi:hypothetical protein